jgi:hypothetical protein
MAARGGSKDTSNDWTTVGRRKGRKGHKPNSPDGPPSMWDPDNDVDLAELQRLYEDFKRTWISGSCRQELRQILDRIQPDDGWQMKNAICLASGSFSRTNVMNRGRSLTQFVAFMDTVEHVQATSNHPIRINAKEKFYTDVDVEFLTQLGVEVHNDLAMKKILEEDPHAWSDLGPESMIFELFMEPTISAFRKILESGSGLIISTHLPERFAAVKEGDFPALLGQFKQSRLSYEFPKNGEHDVIFMGLRIFYYDPTDENIEAWRSKRQAAPPSPP